VLAGFVVELADPLLVAQGLQILEFSCGAVVFCAGAAMPSKRCNAKVGLDCAGFMSFESWLICGLNHFGVLGSHLAAELGIACSGCHCPPHWGNEPDCRIQAASASRW